MSGPVGGPPATSAGELVLVFVQYSAAARARVHAGLVKFIVFARACMLRNDV